MNRTPRPKRVLDLWKVLGKTEASVLAGTGRRHQVGGIAYAIYLAADGSLTEAEITENIISKTNWEPEKVRSTVAQTLSELDRLDIVRRDWLPLYHWI